MKKILAVVLAIAALFTCVVPASAATNHLENVETAVEGIFKDVNVDIDYENEFSAEYFDGFANLVANNNYIAIVQKAIVFTLAVTKQTHAVYHQLAVLCHFHCYFCNEV